MKQLFVKMVVAGALALGGIGAVAAPAMADSLSLGLYSDGIVDVQYRDRDRNYGDERDWGRRDYRPGYGRPGHGRPHYGRPSGRCSAGLATDKARNFGLRRARVVDVTPRRVVVEGRRHGDFRTVVFANVRGCPIIR